MKERPTFVFHFHDKVGQNIANVEHMEVHFDKDMQMQVANVEYLHGADHQHDDAAGQTPAGIPKVLQSEAADALFAVAQDKGWLDANFQPQLSQPKAAILASVLADALHLLPRWYAFEQLWHIPDLANKLSHAQNCQYYADTLREYQDALI